MANDLLSSLKEKSAGHILWVLVALTIPLLSVFGSRLQIGFEGIIPRSYTAAFITGCSLLLVAVLYIWLGYCYQSQKLSAFFWLKLLIPLALFMLAPLALPKADERLHVIVFGLLGFFSARLFSVFNRICVGILFAGGDELLQYFLPDRSGDWADAAVNIAAYFIGGLVVSIISKNTF